MKEKGNDLSQQWRLVTAALCIEMMLHVENLTVSLYRRIRSYCFLFSVVQQTTDKPETVLYFAFVLYVVNQEKKKKYRAEESRYVGDEARFA